MMSLFSNIFYQCGKFAWRHLWKIVLIALVIIAYPIVIYYSGIGLWKGWLLGQLYFGKWLSVARECVYGGSKAWPFVLCAYFIVSIALVLLLVELIDERIPRRMKVLTGSGGKHGLVLPDSPWRPGEVDLLSRGDYVRVLKLMIFNAPRQEGAQYIGLYATWGEGKSSVINMLKAASVRWSFVFVDFAPWDHVRGTAYAVALFDAIANRLPFHLMGTTSRLFRKFGRLVSVRAEQKVAGGVFSVLADVANMASSAEKTKRRLIRRLKNLGKRIVVVIDDLDRLPPKDVYEIIRVVKANGDLPNVTYLLSGDKHYLSSALATELGMRGGDPDLGSAYLEKIVQIEYPLPPIDQGDIANCLMMGATSIPGRYVATSWQPEQDAFSDVLPLVENLRQVRRILNVFEEDIALQSRKRGMRAPMDINLDDALALAILKVRNRGFVERLHAAFPDWVYRSFHSVDREFGYSAVWIRTHLIGAATDSVQSALMEFLRSRMHVHWQKGNEAKSENYYLLKDARTPDGLRDYRLYSWFAFENYFSTKKISCQLGERPIGDLLMG